MASGPTQNYDDADLDAWRPHRALAVLVRVVLIALPTVLAVGFGLSAARWFSADRLGLNPWLWLVFEVAFSAGLLVVAHRVVARLVPLAGLLRLALIFPDRAPSRLSVALRAYSPTVLAKTIDSEPRCAQDRDGALLLDLVAALYAHDRSTRAHCERVQGYAVLIGEELGLPRADAARLSWAALLHDIGKLRVPTEILTKRGRPTDQEWQVLTTHAQAGAEMARPLSAWLGPWLDAVGQHHERWDGAGYPVGLAGEQIGLAARIVAVADAYDVISNARSYKAALPASAARAELARCAGTQFDPQVVRAFLAIGIGKLQATAGPLSLLSSLPGLRSLPGDFGTMAAAGGAAVNTAVATVGAAVIGIALGLTPSAAVGAEQSHAPTTAATASVEQATTDPASAARLGTREPPAHSAVAGQVAGGAPPAHSGSTPTPTPGETTATPPTRQPSLAPAPADSTTSSGVPASTPPIVPVATPVSTPAPAPPAVVAGRAASACERALAGTLALAGTDLSGCNLASRSLVGADFTGATLVGVDLSNAKLTGARFTNAIITTSTFAGAQLTGAKFAGATITTTTFTGATLNSATLDGAALTGCTLD